MLDDVKNCGVGKFVSHGEWIHPDRIIDSHEIIFVTKGEVFINENGVEYAVRPDEILLLDPDVRHFGYRPSTNTEFFWLHWYGPAVPDVPRHGRMENPYCILLYFRQMINARIMQRDSEYMDCLARLVLLEVAYGMGETAAVNPVAQKAAAWIEANCCNGITEAQVADYCKYNVDYLNRLFKSVYSKTIKQYINDRRMEYIKELMLCDNVPLKQVAAKAGFEEYKYFLKFFKYHENITPTEFYKQYAYVHINSR